MGSAMRTRMRCFLLGLLILSLATSIASAQPGATPSGRAAPVEPYDPTVATCLSLGGTALSLGIGIYALDQKSDALVATSAVGLFLAPSAGHVYARDYWSLGLAIRLGSAAAFGAIGGAGRACGDADCAAGIIGVAFGVAAIGATIGAIVDLATASDAARRANRAHRARVTIAPQVAPGHAGLAIAGSF